MTEPPSRYQALIDAGFTSEELRLIASEMSFAAIAAEEEQESFRLSFPWLTDEKWRALLALSESLREDEPGS